MPDHSPYAAVVGGVNLDVCGHPGAPLVSHDSNPGVVSVSLGGVGRNIAHNMALLGLSVKLLTALGDDPNAQRVEDSCKGLGIDLTHSLRVPGGRTSTYLFITDHLGEMELAVSDMSIYDRMTPGYLEMQLPVLNAARLVVCDANIPADCLAFLARRCTAPLFADPVSTAKGEKLRPILGKLHTLKPNRLEASLLSGVTITDGPSLERAARALLDTGLGRVFISLGSDGVYAADHRQALRLPCLPAHMVNATGAGDAFIAALTYAYLQDLSLEDTARLAQAAAAISIEGAGTINPALSPQTVRQRAQTPVSIH